MERTLSHTEAKVVLDLEWRNQKTITLAELRQALGVSESYARKLAQREVKPPVVTASDGPPPVAPAS